MLRLDEVIAAVSRTLLLSAAVIFLSGCGAGQLHSALARAPNPIPQDPAVVSLQATDLPTGLTLCPASGDIDHYLLALEAGGSPSYEVIAKQWATLRAAGANAAQVRSYAESDADCSARLGERKGRAALSVAIRFPSTAPAAEAFRSGFFGLRPEPGRQQAGLEQGTASGLGPESWSFDQSTGRPPVFVAFWSKGPFDLFLFTESMPASVAREAGSRMNGRVR